MRTSFRLICCTLGLVLAGCKTHTAELHPEADPYLSQGRIQFERGLTKFVVDIVRVDTERVGSGLMKVIVTARCKSRSNVFAEFRTTFLDEKRHMLEQTNWEPIELNARTVTEYTCTSLSSRAADYQIIIRKPDKTSFDKP